MSLLNRPGLPESKRDRTIPYTYEAQVDLLRGAGSEPLVRSYFADTLCGLVELLAGEGIAPAEARLFAVYGQVPTPLETRRCVGGDGAWLLPPRLCRALEQHFLESGDDRYRGHVEHGGCAYDDRDKTGHGPY
jgi:hypothetical protein